MKPNIKKILRQESIITIVLYALFFFWWYATAYLTEPDPAKYSYIFGFPKWFFLSCIAGYIGITLILWVCVEFFFTDIPLDGTEDKKDE